jgi:hypothetical protein
MLRMTQRKGKAAWSPAPYEACPPLSPINIISRKNMPAPINKN